MPDSPHRSVPRIAQDSQSPTHIQWPSFNFRDWDQLTHLLNKELQSEAGPWHVERVIIPFRPKVRAGYLKDDLWVRLASRSAEGGVWISLRTRKLAFGFAKGKGPEAHATAPKSPFDQYLSKSLKGSRFLGLDCLPNERIIRLRFSAGSEISSLQDGGQVGDLDGELKEAAKSPATAKEGSPLQREAWLLLWMIPAHPEAMLVLPVPGEPEEVEVLARSRKKPGTGLGRLRLPDGKNAPPDLELHENWVSTTQTSRTLFSKCLDQDIYYTRLIETRDRLQELLLHHKTRSRQAIVSKNEALKENDWAGFGDLLKAHLHELKNPHAGADLQEAPAGTATDRVRFIELEGQQVPLSPGLSATQQLERFYHLAKRRNRRIQEAESRHRDHQESAQRISTFLLQIPELLVSVRQGTCDEGALAKLEREAGLPPPDRNPQSGSHHNTKALKHSRAQALKWKGRTFYSKEGLAIWVGKSKDENLELTFKHAKGNDLWMHVKGKPGAHILIPLNSGKSASLDTLLDAANLCIFYSGGEKWGKTEVDYTFKKYVKRIRDSSEASYTHNKTLVVALEQARLDRLLGDLKSGATKEGARGAQKEAAEGSKR